jgi:hypothetical protein
VNAYKVIAAGVTINAGILLLHSSQAEPRMHRLTALGGNRYEVRDPPVFFKRGETFAFEGELPKALWRSVEAIPISALGKRVLPRPREKKILQIPRTIPEQQNAPTRTRTASATAALQARKASRLADLKRLIERLYEALDKAGHNVGQSGHRKPLPVSTDALHTLFRASHPEHKVARSTFGHDLDGIAMVRPGPKRYKINQLIEMMAGKILPD